jgi:hypothetical protein
MPLENWMIELFLLLMLSLLTFIDLRRKTLPSPLTTSLIFILAIVNLDNLPYGILAFIFGYLMMEGLTDDGEFFSGVADLKVCVALGLMVSNLFAFFLMVMLIVIFGVVYKSIIVKAVKKKGDIAFIPVFLFVYIAMLIIDKVAGGIL